MTSVMYSDLGANENAEATRWLLVIKQRNLLNLFFSSSFKDGYGANNSASFIQCPELHGTENGL